MLIIGDILKSLFCLSPYAVGHSPVTEAEQRHLQTSTDLCQSQINSVLQSKE